MAKTKAKTKTKPKEYSPRQMATHAMRAYIKATAQKTLFSDKQKEAKAKLIAFAEANTDMKVDENIYLVGGYIHFGKETVIAPCEGFDMAEFVKDFPELVDKKFKVAPVKNLLNDAEGRKRLLESHCVELKEQEEITIVIDKKS